MPAPVQALRSVPLFAGLKRRDLSRLAGDMRERTVPAGEEVVSEGKGGVGFFVIAEGRARVSVAGRETRTLGPGDHFGEVALIDGAARSASIIAEEDLRVFGMTAWSFRPFVTEHPDVAWSLLETLARRLREAEAA